MLLISSLIASFFLVVFFTKKNAFANQDNCGDLSVFRSDSVLTNLEPAKLGGRWFEVAYHDLAQVKETCQYYDRTLVPAGMEEAFHFTYPEQSKSGALPLFYSPTNMTGVYDRFVDAPLVNKMKFPTVVVDFTVDATTGDYKTLTEFLCYDIKGVSYMEVRIGSRTNSISDAQLATLEAKVISMGIPAKVLVKADHSNCQYDPL